MSISRLMQMGAAGGGSVIEFVGAVSTNGSDILDLTGITDLQTGDLVIFSAMDDINGITMDSNGWSGMNPLFPSDDYQGVSKQITGYKVMGATIDTEAKISGARDGLAAIAFRNAGTPPSGPDESTESNDGTREFSIDNFLVGGNNSVVLVISYLDDDNGTISTAPSGFTVAAVNGRLGGSIAMMYRFLDSGLTPDIDGLWSSSDDVYTVAFAIGPA